MSLANQHSAISSLLARQDLWLGDNNTLPLNGPSTGFTELAQHLPHWPAHGVCELYSQGVGSGELGLLLPLLTALCADEAQLPIMLIAPTALPNAYGLALLQLPPERFIWLDVTDAKEALWAMEQALHSGSCSLVLGWFDKLSLKAARRLQLAAEESDSLGVCFLPLTAANNQHPLPLKLALHTDGEQPQLDIIKRRGGWPVAGITLTELAMPMLRRLTPTAVTPKEAANPHTANSQQGDTTAEAYRIAPQSHQATAAGQRLASFTQQHAANDREHHTSASHHGNTRHEASRG